MTIHDFFGLSPLFAFVIAIIALLIKGHSDVRKWEEANRISEKTANAITVSTGVSTARDNESV